MTEQLMSVYYSGLNSISFAFFMNFVYLFLFVFHAYCMFPGLGSKPVLLDDEVEEYEHALQCYNEIKKSRWSFVRERVAMLGLTIIALLYRQYNIDMHYSICTSNALKSMWAMFNSDCVFYKNAADWCMILIRASALPMLSDFNCTKHVFRLFSEARAEYDRDTRHHYNRPH